MNHGEWDAWCPASGVRILKSSALSLHLVLTIVEIVVTRPPQTHSRSLLPHWQDCSDLGMFSQGSENAGRHTALTLELRPLEQAWSRRQTSETPNTCCKIQV